MLPGKIIRVSFLKIIIETQLWLIGAYHQHWQYFSYDIIVHYLLYKIHVSQLKDFKCSNLSIQFTLKTIIHKYENTNYLHKPFFLHTQFFLKENLFWKFKKHNTIFIYPVAANNKCFYFSIYTEKEIDIIKRLQDLYIIYTVKPI